MLILSVGVVSALNAQVTVTLASTTSPTSPWTVPTNGSLNVTYTITLHATSGTGVTGTLSLFTKGDGQSESSGLSLTTITAPFTGDPVYSGSYTITQSDFNGASCLSVYAKYDVSGTLTSSNSIQACKATAPAIATNTITAPSPASFSGSGDAATITGSTPTGGTGTYTYQWQSSTTSTTTGFANISGATGKDYNPPLISVTTYYRRVVSSSPASPSTSNVVTISITPGITGNVIAETGQSYWTIGNSADPAAISTASGSTLAGGTGTFTYQWQSTTNLTSPAFANISGATSASYDPGTITTTTLCRRIVTSGASNSTSNSVELGILSDNGIEFATPVPLHNYSTVTVPTITGDDISPFTSLTVIYYWAESDLDASHWHAVFGHTYQNTTSNPAPETRFFRREATIVDGSGHTVFDQYSYNTLEIDVADPITNNTISITGVIGNSATVLYATDPAPVLLGSTAIGGFTPLTYHWQQSIDNTNWSTASGGTLSNGGKDYQPPSGLSGNYYFRRTITDAAAPWGDGMTSISSSMNLHYNNQYPIGANFSNPITTGPPYFGYQMYPGYDCLEVLRTQDMSAQGFSNNYVGYPGKEVYFKMEGTGYVSMDACWSTVAVKAYLLDASGNQITPLQRNSDCYVMHWFGFSNSVFYLMVEGESTDGIAKVQFFTSDNGDCVDSYQGFAGSGAREGSAPLSAIYPNPAKNTTTIAISNPSGEAKAIRVYNKMNVLVKSFETSNNQLTFSVEDLAPDTYIIKVDGSKNSETHRLVVR